MLKPRYDLTAAQAANVWISDSCAEKANHVLVTDKQEARRYIEELFKSLVPADFAYTETMRPLGARALHGDVYGKKNADALWFVKIKYDATTTTVIMSCHEAEHPIALANGTTLSR